MVGKPRGLETGDDLRVPIQRLDQVRARIARLLADLAAPKPVPRPLMSQISPRRGRERRLQVDWHEINTHDRECQAEEGAPTLILSGPDPCGGTMNEDVFNMKRPASP